MPQTPDARPGELIEEEGILLSPQAVQPSKLGELRNVSGEGLVLFEDGVVHAVGESRVNTWQPPVDERDVNAPPGSPALGYRVIVGAAPTGVFVGHAGEVAQWTGSAWVFSTPKAGTVAHVRNEAQPVRQTAAGPPWAWSPFSLATHGYTHEHEGADELVVQDLGSGEAVAGKLLQTDGAGGWELVGYVPGTPPELQWASYTTPFSTSSGTYQQVWRYTTTSLPAGDYFVAVQADLDTTNSGNVTDARVQLDDTTTIAAWIAPVGYVGGQAPLIGVKAVTLAAGVHTIDFDVRKVSGLGSVVVKACYVLLWRVS